MIEPLFHLSDENFSFESHGVIITVKRYNLPGHVAYRVDFSSSRKSINIAKAMDANFSTFWTAIPEGQNREKEAQGVGKLIEEYLQQKK
jgi:hypothetical protein